MVNTVYRVIKKKIAQHESRNISEMRENVCTKFRLFRTKLRISVLLRAVQYLLHLRQNDANANFKNEFRN